MSDPLSYVPALLNWDAASGVRPYGRGLTIMFLK